MSGILDRTSLTYVLSFQPETAKPDGAYHKLRVELKNAPRGIRVAYRAGYYAPRPYGQLNPLEKLFEASSRLMGGEESGAIPGAVLARPLPRRRGRGGGKAYVPVLIEADGPALLAADAAGKEPKGTLPVEVYAYALDAGGAHPGLLLPVARPRPRQGRTLLRQGGSGSSATSTCRRASTRCARWCATAPPAPSACGPRR